MEDYGTDGHADDATASHGTDVMEVRGNGETYEVAETEDINGDGINDAYVEHEADGEEVVIADTDGDGLADEAAVYDSSGNVEANYHYDEHTDSWDEGPGTSAGGGTEPSQTGGSSYGDDTDTSYSDDSSGHAGSGEDVEFSVDGETYDAGHATEDLDGDGVNDTAVVQDGSETAYVEDTNHDGQADVVYVEDRAGNVEVYEDKAGDGQWSEVDTGHVDSTGTYVSDTSSGRG